MATTGISDYAQGVSTSLFTIGYRCWVRVADSANGEKKKVGFIDSMSATKQIQTQRAQVCGSIMPASIDPQSISFNVSLSGFLATPSVYKGTETYNGGGTLSLQSFNPASEEYTSGKTNPKFGYMDFYDDKKGIILCKLYDVIPTNFQINVQGGAYGKASISLEALNMSSGADYMDQNIDGEVS